MARSFGGTSADEITASLYGMPVDGSASYTFSAFVFANSFSTSPSLISFSDPTNASGFVQLSANTTGKSVVAFQDSSGTTTSSVTGTTAISTSTWFHIAGIITKDPQILTVYTNGADKTVNNTSDIWGSTGFSQINLGFLGRATAGSFHNGRLADCAIWKDILNDAEIRALARGVLRPGDIRPNSLVRWWPLDGYGHRALDRSINKRNGILTGTTLAAGPPLINPGPPPPFRFDLPKKGPIVAAVAVPKMVLVNQAVERVTRW